MITKLFPITEKGDVITKPEGGFIVQGNVFVAAVDGSGSPSGGLIGNAFPTPDSDGKISAKEIMTYVYTKKEMLRALGYTREEMKAAIALLEVSGGVPDGA